MATRESDGTVYTHAGPEIGVASTKAFTTQLVALQLLAIYIAQVRGVLNPERAGQLLAGLDQLPAQIEEILRQDAIKALADRLWAGVDFLYLGRGINYPIALEGALKLKEISVHPRRRLPGRRDETRARLRSSTRICRSSRLRPAITSSKR